MPTYEYHCKICKHRFERFQSMKDSPLRKCPACGKAALERLIGTGGAVIFKGSGFYQTDYRSDSYQKAAEADKPKGDAKPTAGAAAEGKPKADVKPAASEGSAAQPSGTGAHKKRKPPAA